MRIAYFSPFNPIKSGISDYSEELLPYLSNYADIDLYAVHKELTNETITSKYKIYSFDEFEKNNKLRPYDANLYHIGNNSVAHEEIYAFALTHPGIIVLHDYVIHNMIAGMTVDRGKMQEYVEEMAYSHGSQGREVATDYLKGNIPPPWENNALDFPVNRKLIESSLGIIVHSYFTRNLVKTVVPFKPVRVIPHYTNISKQFLVEYEAARQDLGIELEENIIAMFGFITESKRLVEVLSAVARLHFEGCKFKFYIVGEVTNQIQIAEYIDVLGLSDNVVVFTGHLELPQFTKYMQATDICINLRYPANGETSGSLHRLLGMGKPVLVTRAGPFNEYPEDTVIKIDVGNDEINQIYCALKGLFENSEERLKLGELAYGFVKQYCSPEVCANAYFKFIEQIVEKHIYLEGIVEKIACSFVALGLDDEALIRSVAEELAGLS